MRIVRGIGLVVALCALMVGIAPEPRHVADRQANAGRMNGTAAEANGQHTGQGARPPALRPGERARVDFLQDGVRVEAPPGRHPAGGAVEMHLARAGREGALSRVAAAGEPETEGNRVLYRRGPLTEWYIDGPLGLEQGFTMAEPPTGRGRVVLQIAVGAGVDPRLSSDGKSVELYDAHTGDAVGRYADLDVRDARGQSVEARMRVEGTAIALSVDDRGAVYPIVVDPTLTQVQEISPTGANAFGFSLAIDGNTAVIGAQNNVAPQAAYVFMRSGDGWTFQQQLLPPAGDPVAAFGWSVAINGDTALVGDPLKASSTGEVYAYTRTSGSWGLAFRLFASDPVLSDRFGDTVAVSGTTAFVGAPRVNNRLGAVYVFTQSGATWTQQQKIDAPPGAPGGFGLSIALSGNTAFVGAPGPGGSGHAYVFANNGVTWSLTQDLTGDNIQFDLFGIDIGLQGTTAVIGAEGAAASGAGAAYSFTNNGSTWVPGQRIVASDGASSDRFGHSVSLTDTALVVGAPGKNNNAGAAYFFTLVGVGFQQQQELLGPFGGVSGDIFGMQARVAGGPNVLIGAPGRASSAGAVYVFASPALSRFVPALSALHLLALVIMLGGSGLYLTRRPARAT
jgi:hypothetical protein